MVMVMPPFAWGFSGAGCDTRTGRSEAMAMGVGATIIIVIW
jgi:hypothetical protein